MPEEALAQDLWVVSLDSLKDLKSRWLVSIGALLYRVGSLGWLTESQHKSLWINYSRRGWKRSEPLDDSLEPEEPRMLARAIQMIIDKGGVPPSQVVSDLLLHPADISELAGLPESYLKTSADLDFLSQGNLDRDLHTTEKYFLKSNTWLNTN